MKRETEPLQVYGNDYDTPDGTCIRDYTHVVDLAKGHLKALEKIKEGCQIYNLGTGKGTSVLELIHAFERITGEKVPIEMGKKRLGDIGVSYADVSKAKQELGWQAEKGLDAMVADTYRFVQKTKGTVPFVF
jgi:UDP-glucose 4-epimerase